MRRDNRSMSGSGGASGYEYQAAAFAYVASYALAGKPVNIGGRPDDVPISIRMETGEGGDDLRITMATAKVLDIQAKYHARDSKKFRTALVRLIRALAKDPDLRGVLLVDSQSALTIRKELARDVERLGRGLDDSLGDAAKNLLADLRHAAVSHSADIWRRLGVVTLDLEDRSSGQEAAFQMLRSVLNRPDQSRDAWERLVRRGLAETKWRGKSDVAILVEFLAPTIPIAENDTTGAGAFLVFRKWAFDTFSTFPVIGFRSVRIAASEAWDEAAEVDPAIPLPQTLDEELTRYHGAEEASRAIDLDRELQTDDLLLMAEDVVVVGAAGGGKSVLTRRLVVEGLREGILTMRVPLKHLASRLDEGRTIDEALADVALDGSGITNRQVLIPTLLIADGLDECGERRAAVADALMRWRRGHRDARLIVTTRSFGHSPADLPGLLHCELQPLYPGAIGRLAMRIFEAYFKNGEKAEQTLERFEDALEENRAAAIAARTPLLLGCLAAIFVQGRPLPSRRAQLFAAVIELLRDAPVDRSPSIPVNDAIVDRVMEIAGWLLVERPAMGKSELRDRIGEELRRDGLVTSVPEGRNLAANTIAFWEQHRLMERLTTGAMEIETFVHFNLAEYAAGRFAAALPNEQIDAWIRRSHPEPRWRQPILLCAGAGAVAAVVGTLLDVNDETGAASIVAAEAIVEAGGIPGLFIDKTVITLAKQLSHSEVRTVVESAEGLISLRFIASRLISEVTLPLLDHENALTRLAAEGVVLAGDADLIPTGMPQRWLALYLPVPGPIDLPRTLRPPERLDLPAGARELNQYCVELALDALFRTLPHEEAIEVASAFLTPQRRLPSILVRAERVFHRHGHADEFRERTAQYMADLYPTLFPSLDSEADKATLVALLDAIAAAVGKPDRPGVRLEKWKLISRILAAMQFFKLEPVIRNSPIGKRADQSTLEFAVARTITALGLDHDALRTELGSAYATVDQLSARGMYPYVRMVRMRIDWRRASLTAAPALVEKALHHPSASVRWVGRNLAASGAAPG